jgi:hypothetical protein
LFAGVGPTLITTQGSESGWNDLPVLAYPAQGSLLANKLPLKTAFLEQPIDRLPLLFVTDSLI